MVALSNMWIPSPLSKAEGKEIERLSLIGPFLSLSVFSEECVSYLYICYYIRQTVLANFLPSKIF